MAISDAKGGSSPTDRHATLLSVVMAGSVEQAAEQIGTLRGVVDRADGDGFEVLLAALRALSADLNTIAEQDLRQGETIGVVVALAVLVAVSGAVVAALLPVGLAVLAIVAASGGWRCWGWRSTSRSSSPTRSR